MTSIIPLGTSSAMPVPNRHFSSIALQHNGRLLLFDCGEGTQLQFRRARLPHARVDAIFITHLHGDHVYGLFGILSTLSLLGHDRPLTIVGPEGVSKLAAGMPGLQPDKLPYALQYVELSVDFEAGVVFDRPGFQVVAHAIEHTIFAVGYRFEEKPRPGNLDVERARALGLHHHEAYRKLKQGETVTAPGGRQVKPEEVIGPAKPGVTFAYVTDSRPCEGGRRLAHAADLVYHEATFEEEHRPRALETGHSTAREAAEVARDAGAQRLLLGHFSARYTDTDTLLQEARAVFQNTEAADELNVYTLASDLPD